VQELIDALVSDIKACEGQCSVLPKYSETWGYVDRMAYAFKVALGRAILVDNAIVPTDVDKALLLAEDYLLHN
jgi:hypothetical protein